ncbi:MFS transporter [Priestia megaterium]|uniref:MFS transporter n=1 Tax=Priestia megaterium TaxID=1404 RepID=UPI002A6A3D70|nr:MFS transporter [Priestia megaterium]MDY0943206.1 MFS transporter [Priestia megaterium]
MKKSNQTLLFGLPVRVILGFIAILLFMSGDGIEQAFLSKYIVHLGFSVEQSSWVFTIYGITLTIASWLAGILTDFWGAKKTMLLGLITWVIFEVGFLYVGLELHSYAWMWIFYGLRGFGYPLFAFSFIVWVAYITDQKKLGTAIGWFFFMFAGGIGFIGAYYPSLFLDKLGEMTTLWSSLAWIIAGGIMGVLAVNDRDRKGNLIYANGKNQKFKEFSKGITILWENPRIALGGFIRTINTSAWYGFVVIMPLYYTNTLHFSTSQWLQIWAIQSISNMVFNVIWGYLGDKIGWIPVIRWFGGIGSAIACLLYFYGPILFGQNYVTAILIGIFFGATIAAFVPLSALMAVESPRDKGAAMAILNLGAGFSSFIGPALITILYPFIGIEGLVWVFASLYILAFILSPLLRRKKVKLTSVSTFRDEKVGLK